MLVQVIGRCLGLIVGSLSSRKAMVVVGKNSILEEGETTSTVLMKVLFDLALGSLLLKDQERL